MNGMVWQTVGTKSKRRGGGGGGEEVKKEMNNREKHRFKL